MGYTVHNFDDYFEQQEKERDFTYGNYKETASDFAKKLRKPTVTKKKSTTKKIVEFILNNKNKTLGAESLVGFVENKTTRSVYIIAAKKELIKMGYSISEFMGDGLDYRRKYFILTD